MNVSEKQRRPETSELVLIEKIKALTELAHQYREDMRYPPAEDSRKRRIELIEHVIFTL